MRSTAVNGQPLSPGTAAPDHSALIPDLSDGGRAAAVAVPLDDGETIHGRSDAFGWRFRASTVTYAEPVAVGYGGPLFFTAVTAAAAIGRRRVRRQAAALAAPQWRPLGHLDIIVTNQRLLVWHDQCWASVWYSGIAGVQPDWAGSRLTLTFQHDPPYHLAGLAVSLVREVLHRVRYSR